MKSLYLIVFSAGIFMGMQNPTLANSCYHQCVSEVGCFGPTGPECWGRKNFCQNQCTKGYYNHCYHRCVVEAGCFGPTGPACWGIKDSCHRSCAGGY